MKFTFWYKIWNFYSNSWSLFTLLLQHFMPKKLRMFLLFLLLAPWITNVFLGEKYCYFSTLGVFTCDFLTRFVLISSDFFAILIFQYNYTLFNLLKSHIAIRWLKLWKENLDFLSRKQNYLSIVTVMTKLQLIWMLVRLIKNLIWIYYLQNIKNF